MKPISNTAFYCCGVRRQDAEIYLKILWSSWLLVIP